MSGKPSEDLAAGTARSPGRVHIVGAGPVGLFLTALLQSVDGQAVRLYERREAYTRTRMVSLAEYLVADSIESYEADTDRRPERRGDLRPGRARDPAGLPADDRRRPARAPRRVDARVRPAEHHRALAERAHRRARHRRRSSGSPARSTADEALAMLEPGDVLVDCTGSRSLLRDLLVPGDDGDVRGRNTLRVPARVRPRHHVPVRPALRVQRVLQVLQEPSRTPDYKFIPAVHRTYYDGSVSHVTGIVNISQAEYEAMPPTFDGAWLREQFPTVAASMDRFIDKVKEETHGELVGDLEITRIPLDVYRARNATSRRWLGSGASTRWRRPGLPARGLGASARRTSSRSRSASSARSSWPGTSPTGTMSDRGRSSIATSRSCTSSGCGSTCAPR